VTDLFQLIKDLGQEAVFRSFSSPHTGRWRFHLSPALDQIGTNHATDFVGKLIASRLQGTINRRDGGIDNL
jgi:hypothetical protein